MDWSELSRAPVACSSRASRRCRLTWLSMVPLKLVPRLVPRPLWGLSAKRLLKHTQWREMRTDALVKARNTCVVCGTSRETRMVCDEVWSYDEGIATLTELRILCPDCDAVVHIGQTSMRGFADVARDYMASVNGLPIAEADEIIDREFARWRELSKQSWRIAVAPDLLAKCPALAALVGLCATEKHSR